MDEIIKEKEALKLLGFRELSMFPVLILTFKKAPNNTIRRQHISLKKVLETKLEKKTLYFIIKNNDTKKRKKAQPFSSFFKCYLLKTRS